MDLTEMRGLVRRDLKDETPASYRWTDDDVDRAIQRGVEEFQKHVPSQEKATLATTDGSRDIDISSLTGRVSVDKVEFPIDEFPKSLQPFEVYQELLTLTGDYEGNGDNCYIFWSGAHTLDAAGSTIPAIYEGLIALGACAFALEAYADHALAEKLQTALESAKTALDKVSGQITKAEAALDNAAAAATDIQTQLTSAAAELGKASDAIAVAIATGAGSIDTAIQGYLTSTQARIDAAVTNLTSANTALGSISARLTQAVTDLTTGDDYINAVNVGGDVSGQWAEYAQREVDIALGYNREADGYLGEAGRNLEGAGQELAAASELDKKRSANLIAGARYVDTARGYLGSAGELNQKRRAYLEAAQSYIATNISFVGEANQHRQAAAEYNRMSKSLAVQAKNKLNQLQKELKAVSVRRRPKFGTMEAS